MIIAAFTVKGSSLYLAKAIMISVGEEIKKKLQVDMIKSLIQADTQIIDKKHSGKFISNLTSSQRKTLGFPDINTLADKIKQGVLARYPLLKSKL